MPHHANFPQLCFFFSVLVTRSRPESCLTIDIALGGGVPGRQKVLLWLWEDFSSLTNGWWWEEIMILPKHCTFQTMVLSPLRPLFCQRGWHGEEWEGSWRGTLTPTISCPEWGKEKIFLWCRQLLALRFGGVDRDNKETNFSLVLLLLLFNFLQTVYFLIACSMDWTAPTSLLLGHYWMLIWL